MKPVHVLSQGPDPFEVVFNLDHHLMGLVELRPAAGCFYLSQVFPGELGISLRVPPDSASSIDIPSSVVLTL